MQVAGLISGTSYDGIDAAVVDFTLDGATLRGHVRYSATTPYPTDVAAALHRAQYPAPVSLAEVTRLDTSVGQAFAEAATYAAAATDQLALVCSHGQTVYHWVAGPDDAAPEGSTLGTLQLGAPAWIAERTGLPVLADLRSRDIAAGGQGAPLVPVLDLLLLAGMPGRVAALNIGGIANLTVAVDPPIAYDTGPGNALIDLVAREATGASYDIDGALGARGTVDKATLRRLLSDRYFVRTPPKSTGREYFDADFLRRHKGNLGAADLAATLTAFTAESIAAEVRRYDVDTVVVSGGGIDNPVLRSMIEQRLPGVALRSSADLGAPPDAKEAILFALIGWLGWHGLPVSLCECTGARKDRILGSFTPGRLPLQLPEPLAEIPSRLVIH